MSQCCDESNCRRSSPMMLMRSGLTQTWYVVTRYKELGQGRFEALEKHRLSEDQQSMLDGMSEGAHLPDGTLKIDGRFVRVEPSTLDQRGGLYRIVDEPAEVAR